MWFTGKEYTKTIDEKNFVAGEKELKQRKYDRGSCNKTNDNKNMTENIVREPL